MALELSGFQNVSSLLRAGVYALCKNGVVIYVGKSKSLYSRIYTHRNLSSRGKGKTVPSWMPQSLKGIVFDEVHIRTCTVDELDTLEAAMINLYKPKYNISLRNGLKVSTPITLTINGRTLALNGSPSPAAPRIERRV